MITEINEANQHLKHLNNSEMSSEQLTAAIEFFNDFVETVYDYSHRSISWSVLDFESQAQQDAGEDWEKVYDKDKFEDALYKMISKSDCNYGTTWTDVSLYLEECLKDEEEEK